MIALFQWFTKLTGFPAAFFAFHTKVYYENRKVQGRRLAGPCLVVSNHTSVFDFAVLMFVFFTATLRVQMAEVLFRKKGLAPLLRAWGGIFVDRDSRNFDFLAKSEAILDKGGIVGIYPEGRIPRPEEERPLEFKVSAAYLALAANVPVVPVYTDGCYFRFRKRARVIIGEPVNLFDYYDANASERENLSRCTEVLRGKIISLGNLLSRETDQEGVHGNVSL